MSCATPNKRTSAASFNSLDEVWAYACAAKSPRKTARQDVPATIPVANGLTVMTRALDALAFGGCSHRWQALAKTLKDTNLDNNAGLYSVNHLTYIVWDSLIRFAASLDQVKSSS